MSALRLGLAVLATLVLAMGYFASQYAYFAGDAAAYSSQVDTPVVQRVALVLLFVLVVLAFIPEKRGTQKDE